MADAALETVRESGVEILTMSPEEAARITEAFAPVLADFKAQDFNGVSGAEIFAAMKGE
ncbi:hypothetical protein [Celeribacter sp.]|uniref:hypothetical protein n=1 Tax=Celeribacter sp. TaxID=1890673 RepID=UPI003A8E7897